MRTMAALIVLVILGCALLASNAHKPFPLLIDEAKAVTIVCNPVLVAPANERSRKVQRV